jgi:hypothetical protein
MDDQRFDELAHFLGRGVSRRGVLGLLASGLALTPLAAIDADARKRKKKKPKKCTGETTRCGKRCVDTRTDPDNCGACGTSCGANAICDEGACRTCDVCADGCPFAFVQAAIDAASKGDTVAVCPGTYTDRAGTYEAFAIYQPLTLVGGIGTVLEAKGKRSVFWVYVPSQEDVTLRNLTITGGDAESGGGGIHNLLSAVTLTRCVVRGNKAPFGGGIYNREGKVAIQGGVIRDNVASGGGGIQNSGELILDRGALVTRNTATGSPAIFGGGIYNEGEGTVTLVGGSRVTGNTPDNCIFTPACWA